MSLRERAEALESEAEKLRTSLADEADRRQRENRVLARKVKEIILRCKTMDYDYTG